MITKKIDFLDLLPDIRDMFPDIEDVPPADYSNYRTIIVLGGDSDYNLGVELFHTEDKNDLSYYDYYFVDVVLLNADNNDYICHCAYEGYTAEELGIRSRWGHDDKIVI